MSPKTTRGTVSRRFEGVLTRLVNERLLRNQQLARRDQFESFQTPDRGIVFLGDSITEGGNWNEHFPDAPVLNRGIGGETSRQVLDRLDSAIRNPLGVFLLAGTNDIGSAVPVPVLVETVRRIAEEIGRRAPDTPLFVQSIMPRALRFTNEVADANQGIRAVVDDLPSNVTYLDLWPSLASPAGSLRRELTLDNLHLNGRGYLEWVQVLRPLVEQLQRS